MLELPTYTGTSSPEPSSVSTLQLEIEKMNRFINKACTENDIIIKWSLQNGHRWQVLNTQQDWNNTMTEKWWYLKV